METLISEKRVRPLWDCDPTDGRDECNFAEFPLATLAGRPAPGQKTLTFEDQIWDKGSQQRIARKLTISGSDQFGLPTAGDNDVLLALFHLTKCRNDFRSPLVHFTRYELVKFLHWDEGGKSYRRLVRSLNVLAGVTLFYNRAWWDRAGKTWRNQTFHILESVDLRGRVMAGVNEQPLSSFTWNGTVFASFAANYIKKLNLEIYFQLDGAAAKQAYRFLDKRFYRKRKLEFDLRAFACEHLGFSRKYDSAQLKRKLRPAIVELEQIEFLEPMSEQDRIVKRGPGVWSIVLEKKRTATLASIATTPNNQVITELSTRGVSPEVATELAADYSADAIQQQIVAFDRLPKLRRDRIANPAGYLVQAIRRSFTTTKAAEKRHSNHLRTPEKTAVAIPDPQRLARQALWQSLSELEQAQLETSAISNADSFTLAGWQRAREAGSENVAAGYRQALIDRQLDRVIAEPKATSLARP